MASNVDARERERNGKRRRYYRIDYRSGAELRVPHVQRVDACAYGERAGALRERVRKIFRISYGI
jgi:hypothetical protein